MDSVFSREFALGTLVLYLNNIYKYDLNFMFYVTH